MFVQEGVDREPAQAKFISEAGEWQKGHFRVGFKTPEELRNKITGAIHGYEMSRASAPLDLLALRDAAIALLPTAQRNQAGRSTLSVSIAGGPSQTILRPAELEAAALAKALHQQALFGEDPIFDAARSAPAPASPTMRW